MCSIFYPGDIFLKNASCYRVIALHTRRSVCVLPNKVGPTTRETPRARTRAKVVISCSTFSNVDHGYCSAIYLDRAVDVFGVSCIMLDWDMSKDCLWQKTYLL